MVSDAKKKRAALKAAKGRGSSKSLGSADGGATPDSGSSAALDSLVAQVGAASIDDGGDRSVTSVLTSHPQVRSLGSVHGKRAKRSVLSKCVCCGENAPTFFVVSVGVGVDDGKKSMEARSSPFASDALRAPVFFLLFLLSVLMPVVSALPREDDGVPPRVCEL